MMLSGQIMEISDDVFARQFLFARSLMFILINLNNSLYHVYHEHHAEKCSDVPVDEVAQTPLTF
jgi:hypothetical protein